MGRARILTHRFRFTSHEDIMVSLTTRRRRARLRAAPFDLPGTDGRRHSLESVRGANGTVVMFICNHCPYVKAVVAKIVRDMSELAHAWRRQHRHHEQRCRRLPRRFVRQHEGVRGARPASRFPYVHRRDAGGRARLRRGLHAGFLRLRPRPASSPTAAASTRRAARAIRTRARELFDAMVDVAHTGKAPAVQHPSVGCSIKWRRG